MVDSKPGKIVALLSSLLTFVSSEGDPCILIALVPGGETLVDMGVEVTHEQKEYLLKHNQQPYAVLPNFHLKLLVCHVLSQQGEVTY